MQVLRKLIHLAALAAVLCVGLVAIAATVSPGYWADVVEMVRSARTEVLLVGIVLVLVAVLFALVELRSTRGEQFLSFDGENGVVSISTAAMADYISKLAPEFPSVVRLQPIISPRRNAVDIKVDVRVKAGSQVHEMCQLMQQRIRECVVNGLGITNIRRVEVSVRDIVSEHLPR